MRGVAVLVALAAARSPRKGAAPIGNLKARACDAPVPATLPRCAESHYRRVYGDGSSLDIGTALAEAEAAGNRTRRSTVLVVGPGHSGTSTVAAAVLGLGYKQMTHTPGFEKHFTEKHEDGFVVHANEFYLKRTRADKVNVNVAAPAAACGAFAASTIGLGRCLVTEHAVLRRRWATYPRPAVLKDPRFVWTLHLWADIFENEPPPIVLHRAKANRSFDASELSSNSSVSPQNRIHFPRFLDRSSSLPEFSTTGKRVSENSFWSTQAGT